jgi:hypothetical protein
MTRPALFTPEEEARMRELVAERISAAFADYVRSQEPTEAGTNKAITRFFSEARRGLGKVTL